MTRPALVYCGVGLFSLLLGIGAYHLWQPSGLIAPDPPRAGAIELDAIPLADLDGRESRLADWRGQTLVVNFWAPWCAPCRREIPALIEIREEYAARGVEVLGLSFDGEQAVRRFAADYSISYPLFLVAQRGPMYNAAFDNPSGSLPYTAVVDRDLEIRFRHNGEISAERLRAELDKVL